MSFTEFNDTDSTAATDAFTDTSGFAFLNDSSTKGLKLEGSFAMDWTNVVVNDEDATMTLQEASIDRQYGYATLEPAYYIKVLYDLNSDVTFNAGPNDMNDPGVGATNDDSWSLPQLNWSSAIGTNDTDSVKKLPMARYTAHVGAFTAADPTGRSKEYGVNLLITLQNDGAVGANASLNDTTSYTGLIDDVYQLAQEAYWPDTVTPTPAQNDEDLLAAVMTSDRLATYFAEQMAHIENDVNDTNSNGNVLKSWSIQLDAIPHHPGSNLSQFGQVNNVNDKNLFVSGSKIVVNSAKQYTVNLIAEAGKDQGTNTMVDDYVYGIIQQN